MMTGYFHQEALQYLEDVIFPSINRIVKSDRISWEISPAQNSLEIDGVVEGAVQEMVDIASELLERLVQSGPAIPQAVLILLQHARESIERKFGESQSYRQMVRTTTHRPQ